MKMIRLNPRQMPRRYAIRHHSTDVGLITQTSEGYVVQFLDDCSGHGGDGDMRVYDIGTYPTRRQAVREFLKNVDLNPPRINLPVKMEWVEEISGRTALRVGEGTPSNC